MAERVSTGGTMTFEYKNTNTPRLDKERKKEIRGAYEEYYERKRKEKKRRNIMITIAIIILLIILFATIFLRG